MSTYALTLFRKEIKLKEDDGASTIIGTYGSDYLRVCIASG
jgi:hypothetical protein